MKSKSLEQLKFFQLICLRYQFSLKAIHSLENLMIINNHRQVKDSSLLPILMQSFRIFQEILATDRHNRCREITNKQIYPKEFSMILKLILFSQKTQMKTVLKIQQILRTSSIASLSKMPLKVTSQTQLNLSTQSATEKEETKYLLTCQRSM